VQFQEVFRERLRQITAAVNVRAIQTLQTSHIDQLRDMGDSIATLDRMMKDMPQYTQHVEEVRSLANLQNTLAAKIEEIINSTNENKQELLSSQTLEISMLKNTIADLQTKLETEDIQRKLEEHNQRLSATMQTQIGDVRATVQTQFGDINTQIESIRSSIKDTANTSEINELRKQIDSLEKATSDVVCSGDMDKVAEKLNELRKQMDERTKLTVAEIEKHKMDIYNALQEVRNIVNDNANRQPVVVEVKVESKKSPEELIEQGKRLYISNCISCHNKDPNLKGALGPEIVDAPLEVMTSKVMTGLYPERLPEGYTPKRKTKIMKAIPKLKEDIPAIYAWVQSMKQKKTESTQ